MLLYDRVYKEVITMRQKIANFVVTALEIGSIVCLTGAAINAELKRHKAEKALADAELKCAVYDFRCYVRGITIERLEKELEELKAKEGEA